MKRIILCTLLVLVLTVHAAAAYDLNTVSDKTPDELAIYMHPETRHLAEDVVRICAEQGISAEFIAAVMRYERRVDLHNYFGWTAGGKLLTFDNDLQCLEAVIPKIKANYLTPGGCFYYGTSVDAVSLCYNNTEVWREAIKNEMERMMMHGKENT